ncbi:hypothetical protein LDENG_00030270 [Lucifuga dentata]|nr:hypothetical protein LDENG_00030270 [Lucifuga dentata]
MRVWMNPLPLMHALSVRPSLRYVPRRAVLYCPGNDERKLRKLASLDVDCAVLDCEDGVALTKKTEARETIPRMLVELDLGRTEKCVRVNSVSSGLVEADLQVILQGEVLPPAIMLPKVEDTQEVQWDIHKNRTKKTISFIPSIASALVGVCGDEVSAHVEMTQLSP